MSAVRGFAVGTLTLIALEVLSTSTAQASGLLGVASNLFRSFMAPGVPAIHAAGHWGGQSTPAAASTKGAVSIAPIPLAPPGPTPTVVGLNAVNPEGPVNT